MATWDAAAKRTHPIDFRLVHNTFVTMFWRPALLDDTVGWLRSHDYRVAEFDAESWPSDAEMYDDISAALDFPDHFGRNLDALNDCMRDVVSGDYGWDADSNTGLVIVLRAFDAFTAVDRRIAQTMLDIFADHARYALLIGHRVICLIQSNDPSLAFDPMGAMPVMWNDAEWANSKRGL